MKAVLNVCVGWVLPAISILNLCVGGLVCASCSKQPQNRQFLRQFRPVIARLSLVVFAEFLGRSSYRKCVVSHGCRCFPCGLDLPGWIGIDFAFGHDRWKYYRATENVSLYYIALRCCKIAFHDFDELSLGVSSVNFWRANTIASRFRLGASANCLLSWLALIRLSGLCCTT